MQTLDTAIAELAKKGLVDPPAPRPSLAPGANGAAAGAPA
jgi:hypothetical protein